MNRTRRILSLVVIALLLVLTPLVVAPHAYATPTVYACSISYSHPYTTGGAYYLVADYSIGCPGGVSFGYTVAIKWQQTADYDVTMASLYCNGCRIISGGQVSRAGCGIGPYTRTYYTTLSVHDQFGNTRSFRSSNLVIALRC